MGCFAATATHMKKGLIADERHKPAVRKARHDWGRRQKTMRDQPHRLIFLDETGTNTKMTREYGRSLRGERLKGNAPFRRWGNQTLKRFQFMLDRQYPATPSALSGHWR